MEITRHAVSQYLKRVSAKGGEQKARRKIRKIAEKGFMSRIDEDIIRIRFGDVELVTSDSGCVITVINTKTFNDDGRGGKRWPERILTRAS